jgi:pyruvate carboxylase subunit B
MKAYMKVRSLTQKYIDDFLGYFIDSKNRVMNSLLIGPGLPGGMMGSLMADLDSNLLSLNKWKVKNGQPELTQDDLLIKLFDEVTYVWPMVGYPPLVTPYSQYVKNLALMNVIQLEKGKERWTMIADNIWDMILGKSGKLPGEPSPELVALAKQQGREFFTGNPLDLYPDQLDIFREEMKQKNWDVGQDEEELFELAMHPEQYRAYKSGDAKRSFEADLAKRKAEKVADVTPSAVEITNGNGNGNGFQPKRLVVTIDNQEYVVNISYPDEPGNGTSQSNASELPAQAISSVAQESPVKSNVAPISSGTIKKILSPLEGKFFLTKDSSETPLKVGDTVKKDDIVGYIESMKTYNAVTAEESGIVIEICFANGNSVDEDDVLIKMK